MAFPIAFIVPLKYVLTFANDTRVVHVGPTYESTLQNTSGNKQSSVMIESEESDVESLFAEAALTTLH